jgi:hypothetical protein
MTRQRLGAIFIVKGEPQAHEHSRESGNPGGITTGYGSKILDARS